MRSSHAVVSYDGNCKAFGTQVSSEVLQVLHTAVTTWMDHHGAGAAVGMKYLCGEMLNFEQAAYAAQLIVRPFWIKVQYILRAFDPYWARDERQTIGEIEVVYGWKYECELQDRFPFASNAGYENGLLLPAF